MSENNSIGEFIKISRIKEGYKTQKQLSDISGVSQTTLSRIEAGVQKPQPDTLLQLSKYLNTTTYGELMEYAGYLDGLSATDRVFMPKSFEEEAILDENIKSLIKDLSKNDIFPIDVIKGLNSELRPLLNTKGIDMFLWNTPKNLKEYIEIFGFDTEFKYKIYKSLLRVKNLLHIPQSVSKNCCEKVPLLDIIHANIPLLAEKNRQEEIEIPSTITANFALRVEGDNMIFAGILPGDIVLFKQSNSANTGDIVAVGVEDSTWSATPKYLVGTNGYYCLRSANPACHDIELTDKHRIIGVMAGLIRRRAPSENECGVLINYSETFKNEWLEVISLAQLLGLNAKKVLNLIEIQKSLHDRLSNNNNL